MKKRVFGIIGLILSALLVATMIFNVGKKVDAGDGDLPKFSGVTMLEENDTCSEESMGFYIYPFVDKNGNEINYDVKAEMQLHKYTNINDYSKLIKDSNNEFYYPTEKIDTELSDATFDESIAYLQREIDRWDSLSVEEKTEYMNRWFAYFSKQDRDDIIANGWQEYPNEIETIRHWKELLSDCIFVRDTLTSYDFVSYNVRPGLYYAEAATGAATRMFFFKKDNPNELYALIFDLNAGDTYSQITNTDYQEYSIRKYDNVSVSDYIDFLNNECGIDITLEEMLSDEEVYKKVEHDIPASDMYAGDYYDTTLYNDENSTGYTWGYDDSWYDYNDGLWYGHIGYAYINKENGFKWVKKNGYVGKSGETAPAKYTVSNPNSAEGQLEANSLIKRVDDYKYDYALTGTRPLFVFNFPETVTSATITGKKELTGKELKDNDFTFELKEGDEVIDTVKNTGGNFTFNLEYEKEGIHTYTITEKNEGKDGITYDTHTETVTVNVGKDNEGKLEAIVQTDDDGVVFNNTYSAIGSITLSGTKKQEGKEMGEYSFVLKEGDAEIATVKNNPDGTFTFPEIEYDSEGEHTYTISEVNDKKPGITYDEHTERVTVNVTDNGNGTLKTEATYDEDGVVFTNVYNADGAVTITGNKELLGRDLKAGEFSFILNGEEETTIDENGNFSFAPIPYTLRDVGTHTYTITEKNDGKAGITYDSSTKTVTVEVKDNGDGTLSAEVKGDNVKFTNKYNATGKATISGKKKCNLMGTFNFTLKEGDEVKAKATNDKQGNFSFKEISYTLKDVGTHTYTVTEDNDNRPGIIYDTHTETVTIDVKDNGDGTLATEVKTDDDGVTFNNTYSATGNYQIKGKKILSGKAMDNFSFTLNKGDAPIETVQNDSNGNFAFKTLDFTLSDVGTHTYTIIEENDKKGGIAYDNHVETITIKVSDVGDGELRVEPQIDEDGIVFNNSYTSSGSLAITGEKKLEGADLKDDTFTFELKEGSKVIETVKNKGGKINFSPIIYSMSDIGTHTYTVTEKKEKLMGVTYDTHTEQIKVEVSDNGDGTLKVTPTYDNDGAVFNNKYNATGKITLSGKKDYNGNGTFNFILKEDGKDISTATNNESGEFSFDEITYSLKDVGTHTYTIVEENDKRSGVTYDEHIEKVTVKVEDNGDGTLKTTLTTDDDGISFNNVYGAEGTYTIRGTKKLEGKELEDGEFSFILIDEEGKEYETACDKDGSFSFTPFSYKLGDKEFTYTIKENIDNKENIIYDTHEEKVTVKIEDNGDGTLNITSSNDDLIFENKYEKPEEPPTEQPTEKVEEPTETPTESVKEQPTEEPVETPIMPTIEEEPIIQQPTIEQEIPETGDTNLLPLWIALAATSVATLTGMVVKRRKNQ